VINTGGYKIAPGEVEEAARRINGVADCACIAAPDAILGKIPVLAVVMQSGHPFSAERIYTALYEALEQHLLPRVIVETENIPRTANGKPQRAMLKKSLYPEE
jgi:acyl-coenzyme A synthetase/AMP-(fatty) acid ligase